MLLAHAFAVHADTALEAGQNLWFLAGLPNFDLHSRKSEIARYTGRYVRNLQYIGYL